MRLYPLNFKIMSKSKLQVEITTKNTFGDIRTKRMQFNNEQHLENYIAKIERKGVKVLGAKTIE